MGGCNHKQGIKRLFDVLVACLLLVTLSPLLIVLSVLIWFCSGSPVLFRQRRPGLHGRPFTIYKFRTMADVRDVQGNLLPDEQRLTSLGCFLRSTSLDELPELFNVLKGDMSLVVPRPLLMKYLPQYHQEERKRFDVQPGITGWTIKSYDYLAAMRPILLAGNPVNNFVRDAGCGVTVPPGNPRALAEAAIQLVEMPREERLAMAQRGRAYVERYHDYSVLARRLMDLLETLGSDVVPYAVRPLSIPGSPRRLRHD